jgi:hypothetical protein
MTDIEKKAPALVNEVRAELGIDWAPRTKPFGHEAFKALCRAIEQHEAFRQEVSDAVREWFDGTVPGHFQPFIIAKPVDPLVDVWLEAFPGNHVDDARDECAKISEALAKRGGKIVWENDQ